MSIREVKINGKISKDSVQYVSTLVEIDTNFLGGCFLQLAKYTDEKEFLKTAKGKERYISDVLTELYQCYKNLIWAHHEIYDKNAQDLYEFFYQESDFDDVGYYACQFPID